MGKFLACLGKFILFLGATALCVVLIGFPSIVVKVLAVVAAAMCANYTLKALAELCKVYEEK